MKTKLLSFLACLVGLSASAQYTPPPASQAEVNAGVVRNKYVAPATLGQAISNVVAGASISAATNTIHIAAGANITTATNVGGNLVTISTAVGPAIPGDGLVAVTNLGVVTFYWNTNASVAALTNDSAFASYIENEAPQAGFESWPYAIGQATVISTNHGLINTPNPAAYLVNVSPEHGYIEGDRVNVADVYNDADASWAEFQVGANSSNVWVTCFDPAGYSPKIGILNKTNGLPTHPSLLDTNKWRLVLTATIGGGAVTQVGGGPESALTNHDSRVISFKSLIVTNGVTATNVLTVAGPVTNALVVATNGGLFLMSGLYGEAQYDQGIIAWGGNGQTIPIQWGAATPHAKIQFYDNWAGLSSGSALDRQLLITAPAPRVEEGWGGFNYGQVILGNEHSYGTVQINYSPGEHTSTNINNRANYRAPSHPLAFFAAGTDASTNTYVAKPGIFGMPAGKAGGTSLIGYYMGELWFTPQMPDESASGYFMNGAYSYYSNRVAVMHTNSWETFGNNIVSGGGKFIGDASGLSNIFTSPLQTGTWRVIGEGDSLTRGTGSSPGWFNPWTNYFSSGLAWLTNASTTSDTLSNMWLAQYTNTIQPLKPATGTNALLFLFAGINDVSVGEPLESVWANLTNYWQAAKRDGFTLVGFTIPDASSFTLAKRQTLTAINSRIATATNVTRPDYIVDAAAVWRNPYSSECLDGVHWSTTGCVAMAYAAQKALQLGTNAPATMFDTCQSAQGVQALFGSFATNVYVSGTQTTYRSLNDSFHSEQNQPALILSSGASTDAFGMSLQKPWLYWYWHSGSGNFSGSDIIGSVSTNGIRMKELWATNLLTSSSNVVSLNGQFIGNAGGLTNIGHAIAECSYVSNSVATTVSGANVWTLVTNAVALTSGAMGWTVATNAFIYTNTATAMCHMACTISYSHDAAGNRILHFKLYKNGSALPTGEVFDTCGNADTESTAIHQFAMVSPGDKIELYVLNEGTGNPTVRTFNLVSMSLK